MDFLTDYPKIKHAAEHGDVKYLTRALKLPVSSKIEKIILSVGLQHNNWSVYSFFQKRSNTTPNLSEYALECVVRNKQLDFATNILHDCAPTPQTLRVAISNLDLCMIDVLLPHCNVSEEGGKVLSCAVRTGDMEILKRLLKFCNPSLNSSVALQEAVAHQNQEMFDLLYPQSNPQEVWEAIRKDSWFDTSQRKMLKSRLDIDKQNTKLTRAVEKCGISDRKKIKKI